MYHYIFSKKPNQTKKKTTPKKTSGNVCISLKSSTFQCKSERQHIFDWNLNYFDSNILPLGFLRILALMEKKDGLSGDFRFCNTFYRIINGNIDIWTCLFTLFPWVSASMVTLNSINLHWYNSTVEQKILL